MKMIWVLAKNENPAQGPIDPTAHLSNNGHNKISFKELYKNICQCSRIDQVQCINSVFPNFSPYIPIYNIESLL